MDDDDLVQDVLAIGRRIKADPLAAPADDYEVGEECLASLARITSRIKEEIRLAQYSEEGLDPCPRPVYQQLAQLRIVQSDLIPLFIHYRDDWKISSAVLKLLLVLTLPPDDRTFDKAAQSAALHSIREAFLAPDVLAAFVGSLEPLMRKRLLSQGNALLTARECRYFEMLLTLFTNLLKVPNDNFSSTVSHNRMVWNTLVQQCQAAGVFDALIVTIHTNAARLRRFQAGPDLEDPEDAPADGENAGKVERWNLIVLEILVLLYRVEDMEDIARWSPQAAPASRQQRTATGKQTLEQLLQAEEAAHAKVKGSTDVCSNRHTNFGGTLVSAGQGRQVVCSTETFFRKDGIPESEKPERMQKWMYRVADPAAQSSSKSKRVMAEFLDRYLAECNRDFMAALFAYLRDKITGAGDGKEASSASQEHEADVVQFLLWARVTLQYTRCVQVGRRELALRDVADLLTEEIFDVAFLKAADYRMRKLWRPLHVAVALLRELFMALCVLNDNSKQPEVRAGVAKLCSKVMYRKENVDLVFDLMKSFEVHLNTVGYLTDLVQLAHLIVKVIEFVSQEGHIFVKRMRRVPKRPRPRRTEAEEQEADAQFIDDAEADPAQTAVDALEGTAPEPPAEAAAEGIKGPKEGDSIAEDGQQARAKRRRLVVDDEEEEEALCRAAVDDGPEPAAQGEAGSLLDDEDDEGGLQRIRRSNCEFLKESPLEASPETPETNEYLEGGAEDVAEDYAGQLVEEETALSFEAYLLGFVHPKVTQAYLELLRSYSTNAPATNHCIAKMVSRISFTLKLAPVFCHIGYLAVFTEILEERQNKTRNADLYRVAQRMVKEYSRLLRAQPQLVLYSLFWLTRYDAMLLANAPPAAPKGDPGASDARTEEPQEETDYDFQETPEGGWAAVVLPTRGQRGPDPPGAVARENAALLAMEDDGRAIDYEDIDGLARILARHKRRLLLQQQPPPPGA